MSGTVDDSSEKVNNPKNVIAMKIKGQPQKKAAARG
jgi:hypothetical protein